MSNFREDSTTGGAESNATKFHTLQPLRDLQSNWAVDLAKNLEDYLLKICSGEITGDQNGQLPINFAEAALLLQGSVQVYSRKVEYLYSLVLHALDFVSDKRQKEQPEGSAQSEENPSHTSQVEENDQFWGLDDIPVDAKNSLDSSKCKDSQSNKFVKPPANLVVLEGDCLDSTGDGSELESYLLATADLYRDFILLDPCDAVSVNNYLKSDETGKGKNDNFRGDSITSKSRKSFLSPSKRSGGSVRKNQDAHPNEPPPIDPNIGPDPVANETFENNFNDFQMDDRFSEPGDLDDESDEDDPWKPLNPHEPGTLRVKPFRKVKFPGRQIINTHKRIPITREFPLARMHGPISSELTEIWEARCGASEPLEPQNFPFYEKLRDSLVNGAHETCNTFGDSKDGNEANEDDDNNGGFDFDPPDFDNPEDRYDNHEEVPMHSEKHDGGDAYFNVHELHGQEDLGSQPNLEDLCRSHLDSLLASIAETEKQTELASRVSTWKQRIENNLEEQDSRPPFDIHEYGERVMAKLPLEADNAMSFTDIVSGQEKHDVARTFSALLQLVNNGNVDLVKNSNRNELTCYTGEDPFHVRLLNHHDKRPEKVIHRSSKKRAKSPVHRGFGKDKGDKSAGKKEKRQMSSSSSSSSLNPKLSIKVNKIGGSRCTPEGKKRKKTQVVVKPVELHFAG